MKTFIHPTADVAQESIVGQGTKIWNLAQIREGVKIGENSVIGRGVYIDANVSIGSNVKIQNNASVFHGVTIEDCVFVGPHVCFTNDLHPRAVNPDLSFKEPMDWIRSPTRVGFGAAIGANSTIRCGVTIGKWALVGAGSVVTKNVPDHALFYGVPAKIRGWVCKCGHRAAPRCAVCGYVLTKKSLN
jgi:UDP-2-acetamido-3-amino-2,3-dideoxy-glucuronate N-acetyltransferase